MADLSELIRCEDPFPKKALETHLCETLTSVMDPKVMRQLQKLTNYDDVRFFTLRSLLKIMRSQVPSPEFATNILTLLHGLPDDPIVKPDHFLSPHPDASGNKVRSEKEHKTIFTEVWMTFLKQKLPSSVLKQVLLHLDDRVIPFMVNPLHLSEFLLRAFDQGGVVSILALNSLFLLMHNHNLEYPDFYQRLYSLLEPSVLLVKYMPRFFFLCDRFLTSTHIPLTLTSSFMKRLARLALLADPVTCRIIVQFISNLTIRHPSTRKLLDHENGRTCYDDTSDVYDINEPDPEKTGAVDSYLWELQVLLKHYCNDVVAEVKRLLYGQAKDETELGKMLDLDPLQPYEDMMKKPVKDSVPVTFQQPERLFSHELWS